MTRLRRLAGGLFAAAVLAATLPSGGALAADYPNGAVKLVVPFPPGGPVDVVGRLLAQKLSEKLNGSVVVDNKAGAGGGLGVQGVVASEPNGQNLLIGSTATVSILPLVNANFKFDSSRDLLPLAVVATGVQVFVVHAGLPVNSLREFVAYAKAAKSPLTAATGGGASPFFMEMFEREAGIKLLKVPYKGTGPGLADVAAGHVAFTVVDTSAALPLLERGQIRALGTSSLQRNPAVPNMPTIAEQGYPGFEVAGWFGLFAPAGLKEGVREQLVSALQSISQDADINAKLRQIGLTPSWVIGPAAATRVKAENDKFRQLAKEMGIKPE